MYKYQITYVNLVNKEMTIQRWAKTPGDAIRALANQHFWAYHPKRETETESEGCFFKNIRRVGPSEFGHVIAVKVI